MKIQINASKSSGSFTHFWRSTGYTPASWIEKVDMRQQVDYFGMVPFGGVTYVRIHYMLELVRGSGFYSEKPDIDWSRLDYLLDALHENGLKPFFELMGNPSGFFDNFEIDEQAQGWRRFCRLLVERYVERYGLDEVLSWYFETWNEPDLHWWQQSDLAFHHYWDACANGVKDVDPRMRFGGPGTATHLSDRLKSILAHLDSGKDYFTGQKPHVDFISVHEKGVCGHPEDVDPDMRGVVEREVALVEYIRKNHPSLQDIPISNNECDPQVGWKDTHTWRGKPYYAALIARTTNDHLRRLQDDLDVKYELLGNDNGFAGTWGQRTHLARFGNENKINNGMVDQIKKPAHHIMTSLALLGDQRVEASSDPVSKTYDPIGVIATRRGEDQVAVMIYHSVDRLGRSGSEPIDLALTGLTFSEGSLVHYRIDEDHSNPFKVWESGGDKWDIHRSHPRAEGVDHRDRDLLRAMRLRQELESVDGPRTFEASGGEVNLSFDLPLDGVALILLSRKPESAPPAPPRLWARRYHGLTGEAQVLLRWEDCGSRVVKSYEVFFQPVGSDVAERINEPDLICCGFLHVAADVRGTYQVRAVDHWGRSSDFTDAIIV